MQTIEQYIAVVLLIYVLQGGFNFLSLRILKYLTISKNQLLYFWKLSRGTMYFPASSDPVYYAV